MANNSKPSENDMNPGFDDLATSFAASFNVTNYPNDINKPHPRFSQYKMKSSSIGQDVRRNKLLEHQKARRDDFMNISRCLSDGDLDEKMEDENQEEDDEDTSKEMKPRKLRKSYKNQLMLSEWLVEIPVDFAEKWLMILCPEGRRNLVIAANGSTKVFSKNGMQMNSFPSNLPGGNRRQRRKNSYTILDCIYSEVSNTFYILDLMCWDGFQYYDSETEFRFFWVQQKCLENQEMKTKSKINPYSFQTLPYYQCTKESITEVLNSEMPFPDKLDGLLFYHKEVHYVPGRTPLIGWLKGYMVPDMMGIQVDEKLMEQMPMDNTAVQMSEVSEKPE